jgi:hypothetical protein
LKATALLLNWKRSDNLKIIIESLRSQSILIEIFLWNNNVEDVNRYDVDLQINSEKNLMCLPRWFMGMYASSKYIFSLDDDLIFRDSKVVEDCVNFIGDDDIAIGKTGVILDKEKNYWKSKHILNPDPNSDISVDIIKGRFLMCSKKHISKILLNDLTNVNILNTRIEDDIILSSKIDDKKIPSFLYKRFEELPENGVSLYREGDHKESRIQTTNKYFNGYE